jgi:ABC-type multidrug transport system ATPase subunit
MIQVSNVYKTFGKNKDIVALNNVSLSISEGELYGLIGPDGAGKTTLMRILTTLILPDKGNATVANHNVLSDFMILRKLLGYMPGRFSLYQDLTVEENLSFYASIFNTTIRANYHLISDIYVQLEPFKNRRAGALSGGMKQKLALCCALIHKPQVLFLDEPTTGVDVVSRKEFWEMLRRLKKEGITIMVSTPYMDEATLCDRLALIQEGRILSENPPDALIRQYKSQLFAVKTGEINAVRNFVTSIEGISDAYIFGEFLHVKTENQMMKAELLKSLLHGKGFNVEVTNSIPTVEDCFMALMNN